MEGTEPHQRQCQKGAADGEQPPLPATPCNGSDRRSDDEDGDHLGQDAGICGREEYVDQRVLLACQLVVTVAQEAECGLHLVV